MKQLFLSILFLFCFSSARSQPGILVGGVGSAIRFRYGNEWRANSASICGLTAGIMYRIAVAKGALIIEPSLAYIRKGGEYTPIRFFNGFPFYQRDMLDYIQLSAPILLRLFKCREMDYALGAGPYLSGLIGGKIRYYPKYEPTSEEPLKVGDDTYDDYKRLDAGLMFTAGFRYQRFQCRVSYGLGLVNVSSYAPESMKNHTADVSIAYLLRKPQLLRRKND